MVERRIQPGCERLLNNPPPWFSSARLGLLANQASVLPSLQDLAEATLFAGGGITCLFSPQHGYWGEKQANMIESDNGRLPGFELPVYSLYGSVRRPTEEMFAQIDVLLVDLSDVGTRVYTYATTMGLCMEVAAERGVEVVVLDRPNPIGGVAMEGNLLRNRYRSFVGRYRVPMRHGLTLGELALYINDHHQIGCPLQVIPVTGWQRHQLFPQTGLPWVPPSPNMPAWESALLYPGMVLFEGTNISEGRGTTLPFQVFGAPFIEAREVMKRLPGDALAGLHLRPVCFEPTFDKWQGQHCYGFQLHVLDPEKVRPYRFALELIRVLLDLYADEFEWLPPPYEYEYEKLPIDILLGDGELRRRLEQGLSVEALEQSWLPELQEYRERVSAHLLYPFHKSGGVR